MTYNIYSPDGQKILQNQPSQITLNNLQPLHTYSNYKIEDNETGKTITLKPFSTYSKPVQSINISNPVINLSLSGNKSEQITFTTEPNDNTDLTNFTTSNQSVATVNGNGLVTAVGQGTATIAVLVGAKSQPVQVNVGG